MIYATDACLWARLLPVPVRVEYRGPRAATWRTLEGVVSWDGRVLVVRRVDDLPGYVLVAGADWRIDGREYVQGRTETSGPVRLWLQAA